MPSLASTRRPADCAPEVVTLLLVTEIGPAALAAMIPFEKRNWLPAGRSVPTVVIVPVLLTFSDPVPPPTSA